ncbi:MAG: IS630 family transposase [Tatlockia sp.]|jgi:transposase|nr:IS630 family transposase [Tatlockia sp.]
MSNKKLSLKELGTLRKKAVYGILKEGLTRIRASRIFGFSCTSLTKYIREYELYGEASFTYKKRGVKPLSRSYLSEEETLQLIETLLSTTPDELALPYSLWNSKAIGAFIKKTWGICYSERGIRNLVSNLGFSSQKPIKKAYQRNEEKVNQWLNEVYPKIKARAMQEGARIYWADEMGLQSTDNRGRTYGLIGKTPTIKKTGSRFKVNMLAAVSPQGFMNWMVFEENCDSKKFIEFLGRMRRQVKQKIFLIVDNHRVHHSKKVTQYLGKYKDELEIFFCRPIALN